MSLDTTAMGIDVRFDGKGLLSPSRREAADQVDAEEDPIYADCVRWIGTEISPCDRDTRTRRPPALARAAAVQ